MKVDFERHDVVYAPRVLLDVVTTLLIALHDDWRLDPHKMHTREEQDQLSVAANSVVDASEILATLFPTLEERM